MEYIGNYFGHILSAITAVIWAIAVILFKKSGESVHPIALNFFKNLLSAILIIPTIYLFGQSLFGNFSTNENILLLISGGLGIGLADTFFFKSLNYLGASVSAIVDCLYSPFIIILAFFWIGETLSVLQIIGLVLIISAVLTISKSGEKEHIPKKELMLGIVWGVLAMATMAVGIVMIKPLLDVSPLLPLTEVRLVGGGIVLTVILIFHPEKRKISTPKLTAKGWIYLISGSFLGAYVALILWLGGMKYTKASIAAALNQTSNIFIFILAAILLKEPITAKKTIAIILGVTGAFIVTFG